VDSETPFIAKKEEAWSGYGPMEPKKRKDSLPVTREK
jgi:hypothetical protein